MLHELKNDLCVIDPCEAIIVNPAIETEQELDGRWIAEIVQIPGALCYGLSCDEAISKVKALGSRVLQTPLSNHTPPARFFV